MGGDTAVTGWAVQYIDQHGHVTAGGGGCGCEECVRLRNQPTFVPLQITQRASDLVNEAVDMALAAERASHQAEVEALTARVDRGVSREAGFIREGLDLASEVDRLKAQMEARARDAFNAAFGACKRGESYKFNSAEGRFKEYLLREQEVAFAAYQRTRCRMISQSETPEG
jgi:hypothetical protein